LSLKASGVPRPAPPRLGGALDVGYRLGHVAHVHALHRLGHAVEVQAVVVAAGARGGGEVERGKGPGREGVGG